MNIFLNLTRITIVELLINEPIHQGNIATESLSAGISSLLSMKKYHMSGIGVSVTPATYKDSLDSGKLVKQVGLGMLQNYMVWAPDGLKGSLIEYVGTLRLIAEEITGIRSRTLEPIEQWSAHMISDPTYYNKVWTELPTKLVDVNALTSRLSKHVTSSVSDEPFSSSYTDVYPRADELEQCTADIAKLLKVIERLLSEDINKLVEDISKRVTDIYDNGRVITVGNGIDAASEFIIGGDGTAFSDSIKEHNVKEHKRLGNILESVSREVELMGIVVFQAGVVANAHARTIEKIQHDLK